MRNELLTVAGLTPQIVTETLWWLGRKAPEPVNFSAVHIVTTLSARAQVEATLCGEGSVLAQLEHDWGVPAPKIRLHVFDGTDGSPLVDIRTSAESAAFSSRLAELVRRLTMDPDLALHASIAGGRKTMGVHLGHAMSLFARPQDRLSHVLVPPEYENCPDFWYPTPRSKIVVGRNGDRLDTADATVDLIEIEHIRLRGRLSAGELASFVSDVDSLFRRAQVAIDTTGHMAQTSFTIDGVLAGAGSGIPEATRPLMPVIASLKPGSGLTLGVSIRLGSEPALDVRIEASARGADAETTKLALQSAAADIRHAVDLNSTGYRISRDHGNVQRIRNPLWTARIIPSGPSLRVTEKRALMEVENAIAFEGVRIGGKLHPHTQSDLPVRGLARAGVELDLDWTIERIQLGQDAVRIVEKTLLGLEYGTSSAMGDMQQGSELTRFYMDKEDAIGTLREWTRRPDGFRISLKIAAERSLPEALLAVIGRAVWNGRPFRVLSGLEPVVEDVRLLDLADCVPGDASTPFALPGTDELIAAGIPRTWPTAPPSISAEGLVLGTSEGRQIRLGSDDRAGHLYAIGATGTGKSTLLRNLILQDIEAGEGVFVLDPHGDLINDILGCIPAKRAGEVAILDAGDVDYPFGLNFLQLDPERRDLSASFAISELLAIFWRLYRDIPESMGPAFEQYFTVVLKLLMDNLSWPEPNFLDVARVLSDPVFRNALRLGSNDPAADDVLKAALSAGGDASWENIAPYITNKLNRLTLHPLFRNVLCQGHSTVDFREAMDMGRIVLVKLPKGQLPERDVQLLGMLIVGKLFGSALGRDNVQATDRRRMYVYIDEFQNFVTGTVGQMMAEARKYGLGMVLANQNLAQLDPQLRDTVLGNVSSFLAFRSGPADASTIEPFFAPALGTHDLQALPNYRCAARILSGGTPVMPPFVFATDPPRSVDGDLADRDALVESSRQKYGRSRQEVEAKIKERYRMYDLMKDRKPH